MRGSAPFALLIAAALLAAAAPAAGLSVDRPRWTVGDFWTYRTNTTILPGLNLTGRATTTVAGHVASGEWDLVTSGTGTAAGVVTNGTGTITIQGNWTLTAEERLEPVNLHPVYSLLDLSVTGTYFFVLPLPFSLRLQNTTTFQLLSDGWGYPMVVGTSGNVTFGYTFIQDLHSSVLGTFHANGTGEWTEGFSLAAPRNVTTDAGVFETYPLDEHNPDGTSQRTFFAPAAGNDARTESYDAKGNLTAVAELTAYRYQATEAPTYLGLTVLEWGVVVPVVATAAVVLFLLMRRRKRRKAAPVTNGAATSEPTSGPRGP